MSRHMPRLAALLTVLLLAVPAPAALAQTGQDGGGGAFGPLPPAAPEPTATPTPDPSVEAQESTDRTLLFAIGGGLIVLFVVIGRVITRDARKTLHEDGRDDGAEAARAGAAPPRQPGEGEGAREDEGAAPRAAPEPLGRRSPRASPPSTVPSAAEADLHARFASGGAPGTLRAAGDEPATLHVKALDARGEPFANGLVQLIRVDRFMTRDLRLDAVGEATVEVGDGTYAFFALIYTPERAGDRETVTYTSLPEVAVAGDAGVVLDARGGRPVRPPAVRDAVRIDEGAFIYSRGDGGQWFNTGIFPSAREIERGQVPRRDGDVRLALASPLRRNRRGGGDGRSDRTRRRVAPAALPRRRADR